MRIFFSCKLAFLSNVLELASLLPRLTPRLTNTTLSRIPHQTNTFIMNTTFCGVLFSLFLSFPLFAQTSISGIINSYAKVSAINSCDGKLTVSSTTGFSVGDKVLILQMKGATINESNGSSFGNIETMGSAGFYEKNEILSIAGNVVSLKFQMANVYDPTGAVQLVSMPAYQNAVITDTLKAAPWNGQKGGVIALSVEGKLTMNAPINASKSGFRGGLVNVVSSDCNFLTNADDYYYSMTNWKGAPKGEGIAEFIPGKEQGRGAQANGGEVATTTIPAAVAVPISPMAVVAATRTQAALVVTVTTPARQAKAFSNLTAGYFSAEAAVPAMWTITVPAAMAATVVVS